MEIRLCEKIIFGRGAIKDLRKEAEAFGKRVLIVLGRKRFSASDIVNTLKASMDVEVFLGISPEPEVEIVDKVREAAKQKDVVIGLGGGSVIDVAKAAAALVNETAKSAEYQMGRKIEKTGIPFIACPTTAGTGAEVTYNSVLTNRNRKLSIRDHRMMAKRAIVDPELTYTVPRDVASACGMDGLIHAIEGFCSNSSNIFTDALAEKAIKLFSENLKRAVDGDRDAKDAVSLASTMAGIVLANAGLGAVHGLAASLGGFYNIPHGISCAQLLIPVLRYNLDAIREKLSVMQKIFGREPIGFLDGLMDDLGLKDRFIKPKEEALAEIAKNVSGSVRYNPKNLSHKDFINILKEV